MEKLLKALTMRCLKAVFILATIVKKFFEKEKIDQVYLAAAKVGGIQANNIFPAEFIY